VPLQYLYKYMKKLAQVPYKSKKFKKKKRRKKKMGKIKQRKEKKKEERKNKKDILLKACAFFWFSLSQ